MLQINLDLTDLKRGLAKLLQWADKGYRSDVNNAAITLTKDYKDKIKQGVDGSGVAMKRVKDITMEMPIRRGSDTAIRKEVNSSRKPLVARGRAVESIRKRSVSRNRIEIAPSTQHGKIVFGYNASTGKARTKRDPLIVSDKQMDIIESEILKNLDRVLRE